MPFISLISWVSSSFQTHDTYVTKDSHESWAFSGCSKGNVDRMGWVCQNLTNPPIIFVNLVLEAVEAPLTRNLDPVFFSLHFKDHFKQQYNFFGRIFVAVFFVKIFNFIGYANNTTCDIASHNDF